MKLPDVLHEGCVKYGMTATTPPEILAELAEFMTRSYSSLSSNAVLKALKTREQKGSTAVGRGLAIPHGRTDKIHDIQVVAIYSPEGRDFGAYDHEKTHLFVAVLVNMNTNPEDQLSVLRFLADMYEKTSIRSDLAEVHTASELYQLLVQKAQEVA